MVKLVSDLLLSPQIKINITSFIQILVLLSKIDLVLIENLEIRQFHSEVKIKKIRELCKSPFFYCWIPDDSKAFT